MGLSVKRVFKKSSPNSNVTIYVEKREFVDYLAHSEPVEGVVVVNRSSLNHNKRVFGAVVASFRFGREEDEILGMTFCREMYLAHCQVYPIPESQQETPPLQQQSCILLSERLQYKVGEDVAPFTLQLPSSAPTSVVMQQHDSVSGDSCGVRYFLRLYVATDQNDKPDIGSCVNMAIRKVQYAPATRPVEHPSSVSLTKDFPLSPGKIFFDTYLDKKTYYHGEDVRVTVAVRNCSSKSIKHVKVSAVQVADICMFSTGRWKVAICSLDSQENCPIVTGQKYHKVFTLTPGMDQSRGKYGVFTQGQFTAEEECLASTTMIRDKEREEFFGIIITYQVKVKLYLSSLHSSPVEVQCPTDLDAQQPCSSSGGRVSKEEPEEEEVGRDDLDLGQLRLDESTPNGRKRPDK